FPVISNHKYNWKNNPLVTQNEAGNLDAFVQYVIDEGVRIQRINEAIGKKMKAEHLDPERMIEFFEKVLDKAKVAKASKDRCTAYYTEKYVTTNNLHPPLKIRPFRTVQMSNFKWSKDEEVEIHRITDCGHAQGV
ncbi:MAG TPA: hypothetical protein VG737_11975, partial [Cyclobacteriaceae bacterium]|nr:hypothetical protein [Cyclobacteriaceae bacterium]